MPVLFIGHGSPMNALADNSYSRMLTELGQALERPKAIVVVSAHWCTDGIRVTAMEKPRTIHDFFGFPDTLFEVKYPAPGCPELAEWIESEVHSLTVERDFEQWGLDHGTWSILKHMYPKADIPVVQLSLDLKLKPQELFVLGRDLSVLREKGVLLLGSGNLVHNLRHIRWEENAAPYPWATAYDQWIKEQLVHRAFDLICSDFRSSPEAQLSIPTVEHFYPLFPILGAALPNDSLQFLSEEMQNGSIAMRSFQLHDSAFS